MIALLAARLIAGGVAPRLAKPLIHVGLIACAIAAFSIWLALHDRRTVSTNTAKIEAHAQKAGRAADAAAADRRQRDQTRLSAEADQLRKAISDAQIVRPGAPAPLDPARRAYYRCVRAQQQARDRGGPPAGC